jgi:hypothetical protein
VSAVANPRTGVAVYQTYGQGGWVTYGGTSVAAPLIAAVYALAGRPAAGTYPASYPYLNADRLFDVTSGSNGGCAGAVCTAAAGWDGPTGLGTPNGLAAFAPPTGTTPPGSCVPAQLLGNSGFETGTPAPWTASLRILNDSDLQPAHSGTRDAWLDGYGSSHTDTLSQSVSVPVGCHATLEFFLHISTAETTTTDANDTLNVQVDGVSVATYSNLDQHSGYVRESVVLPRLTGPITVTFTGAENASLATSFVLDDVNLDLT